MQKIQTVLRLADENEKKEALEKTLAVYRSMIDENEGFDYEPEHVLVLEDINKGRLIGSIGLDQTHLASAYYFGWENFKKHKPKMCHRTTYEICRMAVFDEYRGDASYADLLILGAFNMVQAWGGEHVIATVSRKKYLYLKRVLQLPVVQPPLPLLHKPKVNHQSTYWETANAMYCEVSRIDQCLSLYLKKHQLTSGFYFSQGPLGWRETA